MINYNSPERQQLVTNIVDAINKRNMAGMNMPWSCIQYWIACSRVEKADTALIRYDRLTLKRVVAETYADLRSLPPISRDNSIEESNYYDAIETLHDHVDAYGEVI